MNVLILPILLQVGHTLNSVMDIFEKLYDMSRVYSSNGANNEKPHTSSHSQSRHDNS